MPFVHTIQTLSVAVVHLAIMEMVKPPVPTLMNVARQTVAAVVSQHAPIVLEPLPVVAMQVILEMVRRVLILMNAAVQMVVVAVSRLV